MADKKKKKPPVKNFKEFDPSQFIETEPKLTEAVKKDLVVISFGRMNPVTVGHEKLVNQVLNVASKEGGEPAIYLSHSSDPKKNPLSYEDKLFFAQKAFGRIVKKSPARTIIEVAKQLQGLYKNLTVVVGSDRVKEFETLLNKYNGKDYKFNKINVVSAGERDPDAEGVEGMSASKMRAAAADGDFRSFKSGLPKKLQSTAKKVYDTTRQGMALDEETMDEAVLSRAQRRKRARLIRRYKGKIALARKKAMRRRASLDVLKRRARKTARNMIKQKLAKSRRFADLDPAAKIAIEKRLEKMPSSRLERLARRILPSLRKKETERMQSRAKNESVNIDDMFEMFMEERTPSGRMGKNVHDIKVKVPGRVNKAIKKATPVYDQRENEPHKATGKHLKDIMQKHGVKPSGKRHYHNDMTGHYMLAHPDNDPAKVHAAASEFEKTVGKAVRTEAKDGDGVNIVKDRPFKGKPMKKEPDSGKGIKYSDMKPGKRPINDDVNEGILKPYHAIGKQPWSKTVKDSKGTAGEYKQVAKGKDFTVWYAYRGSNKQFPHYVVKDDKIIGSGLAMKSALKDAGLSDKDITNRSKFSDGSPLNKGMKESTELTEKLKVSDGLGAWIKDFQDSDAPQFKNADKKKRRDMAIAAFTDAGGELDEENLNESFEAFMEASYRDQKVRKRPHMMLNANKTVKFDGRFKMFKKRNELDESFVDEIADLENAVNEFVELHEGKTIKVDHTAALNAESAGYVLVKDREVIATGTKEEMLEMHEDTPGSRVWLSTKEVGDLVE
jgi:nicotinic acid mononucleotide adenylyltransferase